MGAQMGVIMNETCAFSVRPFDGVWTTRDRRGVSPQRVRRGWRGLVGVAVLFGGVVAGCGVVSPGGSPSGSAAVSVCDQKAQVVVSITLGIGSVDAGTAVGVLAPRVEAAGFVADVKGQGARVTVDVCQAITDEQVTWLLGWLTNSGQFGIHQVLGQADGSSTVFPVPGAGSDTSGLDAALAAKLGWRPAAADLAGFTRFDLCASKASMVVLDAGLGSGVVCDASRGVLALVGPRLLDGGVVESAVVAASGQATPGITVKWTAEGAAGVGSVTGYLMKQASPQDRLALVLGGVLLTAPEVKDAIDTRELQIMVSDMSQQDVAVLAVVLAHSSTPVPFELVDWHRV